MQSIVRTPSGSLSMKSYMRRAPALGMMIAFMQKHGTCAMLYCDCISIWEPANTMS